MTLIHQPRRRTAYAVERGQVSGLLRFLGVTVPRSRWRRQRPAGFWNYPHDHLGLFDQAHRNWRQRHKVAVNGEAVLLNLAWHRLWRLFRQKGFEV